MSTARISITEAMAGRAGRAMLAGRYGAGVLANLKGSKLVGDWANLYPEAAPLPGRAKTRDILAMGAQRIGGHILGEAIGAVRELPLVTTSLLQHKTSGDVGAARPLVRKQKQADAKWRPGDTLLSHNASGAVVEKTAEQLELERLAMSCRGGDTSAWQQLVTTQHRRVYGICFRFTGNASDAEDLTQDVFIKVYKNLETFDGGKGSFTTWLTTLTRNLLVDHFRRTRQDRLTDSIDASHDGESDGPTMADRLADKNRSQHDNVAQQEMRAQIQHALKQISPELREAVILRDLQDMDYKEIAQVLRVPEGTVKSRISRGRAELARLLQRTQGRQVM